MGIFFAVHIITNVMHIYNAEILIEMLNKKGEFRTTEMIMYMVHQKPTVTKLITPLTSRHQTLQDEMNCGNSKIIIITIHDLYSAKSPITGYTSAGGFRLRLSE